jgi:hypothetical protein
MFWKSNNKNKNDQTTTSINTNFKNDLLGEMSDWNDISNKNTDSNMDFTMPDIETIGEIDDSKIHVTDEDLDNPEMLAELHKMSESTSSENNHELMSYGNDNLSKKHNIHEEDDDDQLLREFQQELSSRKPTYVDDISDSLLSISSIESTIHTTSTIAPAAVQYSVPKSIAQQQEIAAMKQQALSLKKAGNNQLNYTLIHYYFISCNNYSLMLLYI